MVLWILGFFILFCDVLLDWVNFCVFIFKLIDVDWWIFFKVLVDEVFFVNFVNFSFKCNMYLIEFLFFIWIFFLFDNFCRIWLLIFFNVFCFFFSSVIIVFVFFELFFFEKDFFNFFKSFVIVFFCFEWIVLSLEVIFLFGYGIKMLWLYSGFWVR